MAYLIRNYISKSEAAGWTENDGIYAPEEKGIGWYGSNKVRLFKNNGLARFENPAHELLEVSLSRPGYLSKKASYPYIITADSIRMNSDQCHEKGKVEHAR